MQSHATRKHLVYPIAAILAFGLVSAPNPTASIPRLAEISTLRLQAEVTSLVTAVVDAKPPAAAVNTVAGPSAAATEPCYYPCTIIDKIIDGLPPNLRNIVLPPLYAAAFVIGLVLAPVLLVTSAIFGWPYSLRPAASGSTPQTSPPPAAAATAADDPISTQADHPGTSSAVPGDTEGADGDVAVGISAPGDDNSPRGTVRGTVRTGANPIESPASPVAPDEAVGATGEVTPATDRPAHTRGRSSAAASTEPGPAPASSRAAKRSVR